MPPTVPTPTNCLTEAQDTIAGAIATLAAFQSLTETADATAAAKKVFLDYWPAAWDGEAISKQEAEARLGGAMVKPSDDLPYVYEIRNGRAMAAGRMEVKVIRLVRTADRHLRDESDRVARNWIGDIMQQLSAWCEANQGRGWLGRITLDHGPNHRPRKYKASAGHVYEAMLSFAWGHPDLRRSIGG